MAQQLFYFILFLNNNIIITSNKIMWGITLDSQKKLEFHPCETDFVIGGYLVYSLRSPF